MIKSKKQPQPTPTPQSTPELTTVQVTIHELEDLEPYNDPDNPKLRHLLGEVRDVAVSRAMEMASIYLVARDPTPTTTATDDSIERSQELERFLVHLEPNNARYLILKLLLILADVGGDQIAQRLLETAIERVDIEGQEVWAQFVLITPIPTEPVQ